MPKETANEIPALTSLRMIAALLVFLHHFAYPAAKYNITNKILVAIFEEGHIGVGIFFTLSGFLITYRYLGDVMQQADRHFSLYDYLRKRIARIWILYYVVLLLAFYTSPDRTIWDITWIQLTLTQGFFRTELFQGVGTAWSLTVEECFYLLAPMVFLTFALVHHRFSGRGWLIHIVFIANVIAWGIFLFVMGKLLFNYVQAEGVNEQYHGFMNDPLLVRYYTIFERFFDFGCGMVGAYIYMNLPAIKVRFNAVLTTLLKKISLTY